MDSRGIKVPANNHTGKIRVKEFKLAELKLVDADKFSKDREGRAYVG